MPRRRESVGRALRRALGEEVVIPKIEPRKSGVSYLLNHRRLQVFHAVFEEPGVHLRALQKKLGIPLQSLRWHVSVLLECGLLQRVSLGKRETLFTPISARPSDVMTSALFRDEKYGPMLRLMAECGEVSVEELRRELDTYQQIVSARLKTLVGLGLVVSRGKGAGKRFLLAPDVPERLAEGRVDVKSAKEELLNLLRDQGLAPKVLHHSGGKLVVVAQTGTGDVELTFSL